MPATAEVDLREEPGGLDPRLSARLLSRATNSGAGIGNTLTVCAPATGKLLVKLPVGCEADVTRAVELSRAAQSDWATCSFAGRRRIFLRFHDLLLNRQDEVLDLIQLETGKARRHAFEEVLDSAVVTRYYARRAEKLLAPRRRKGALPGFTQTWERREPVGVVGIISPWNYPLNLGVTDAVPALLAGNTVILKPAHQTSLTALWAADLLSEAGLPANVFQVVLGDGSRVGACVAEHVDFVMFTGSTGVGRLIARQAAERLIACSLELGGKNPMIVFEDADLDAAIEGAVRGCFVGAGQVCVSLERIYVHESVFARFLSRFAERVKAMQIGPGREYSIEMGSLASEAQLAAVSDHVSDALEKGATLVLGGRRRQDLGPLFYEPTILTDVRPGMKVYAEETFGPVVSVYPFATEDEAVARANDSRYGLNASVWTRDTARGVSLAGRIEAGSVNVNEAYAATWGSTDSPMGGTKDSGLIPRHGAEGILKYTHAQTIAVQRVLSIAPPRWMDPARHARWMTRLLALLRRLPILG